MKIIVASENPVKVNAVRSIVLDYPILAGASVVGTRVNSQVPDQPRSLQEAEMGARVRAQSAFILPCDLSFGIESGVLVISQASPIMVAFCVCVICDRSHRHSMYLGISSMFEVPRKVAHLIRTKNHTLNQAFNEVGIVDDPNINQAGGVVGLLTKGRINRTEFTIQAIRMAMVQLENREYY